jgi:hypothetical protein
MNTCVYRVKLEEQNHLRDAFFFSSSFSLFYSNSHSVIYQNERYDDWLPRLAKIKQVLVNYKEDLVTYHKKKLPKHEAEKMPNGTISCAADGNFLETLNLSSSGMFEKAPIVM